MYAKWIAEDYYAGPNHSKGILIKHGEIRKIHAKKEDDYILEGKDGKGYFGWVNEKNLEILESKNA
jgi:hypothetical protein